MTDNIFSYDHLQFYIPKESFVDAIRRVWAALFDGSAPSRESMALVWAKMALKIIRTGACSYVGKADFFEPVLDETFSLWHGNDTVWNTILAGDPEALMEALEDQDRGKPAFLKEYCVDFEADYHKALDLMTEWLIDTSDVPTIPAPAPFEPMRTKPETPHSIRVSKLLDDEGDE